MNIVLLDLRLLLDSEPYLKIPGLVVSAVGARDKLLVLALKGKPCLQVVFLGGSIVQGTRHNRNDLIRQAQRLVEGLRGFDHGVEHLPGLLRFREDKLLNLLELVDTEDAWDLGQFLFEDVRDLNTTYPKRHGHACPPLSCSKKRSLHT